MENRLESLIYILNIIGAETYRTKAWRVEFSYEIINLEDEVEICIYFKRECDSEKIRIIRYKHINPTDESKFSDFCATGLIRYLMYAKDYSEDIDGGDPIKVYSRDTIFSKDLDLKLN